MADSKSAAPAGGDVFTLSDLFRILKARWAYIFIAVTLACITTAVFTYFQPKWFEATAIIRVQKPDNRGTMLQNTVPEAYDPFYVREQSEILQSEAILGQVIQQLALRRRLAEMVRYPLAELPQEETLRLLRISMLKVESKPGTPIIDIEVSAMDDGRLAAEIANRLVLVYEQHRREFLLSGMTETAEKMKLAVADQEREVQGLRDAVERIRRQYNIEDSIRIDTQSGEVEFIRQLERTLLALRVDMIAQRTRWEEVKAALEGTDNSGLRDINLVTQELVPDPNIQNLLQAYLIAEQTYETVRVRLGENHPDFQAASSSRNTVLAQLQDQLRGFARGLEITYKQAAARVDEMQAQLDRARRDQVTMAGSGRREFDEATRKLRSAENLLDALRVTQRQREAELVLPRRPVELLEPAVPSSRPSRPNWTVSMVIAFVLGVILGVAIAFAVEMLDTSFRSVEDMERKLQLPILGVVSRRLVLVSDKNYNSFEAEPYRVIQTNLELAQGADAESTVLAVQSAGPGEGKSTTLYNLAAAMALSGHRVLVIDTDLRRPSQHRIFEVSRKPGVIDVLLGQAKPEDVIVPSKVKNLSIMPAGHAGHFVLNILHGKNLAQMVAQLRLKYDRILLDSPPVIGISDASVLASMADAVIFVVQHRRNPQTMTQRARQIVQNVDAQILGVVLNQVPITGGEDYNYYTQNYYYYTARDDRADTPRRKPGRARGADRASGGDAGELLEMEKTDKK